MRRGREIKLVFRREVTERLGQRAFRISTLVTVLVVVAAGVLAGIIGGDDGQTYKVGAQGAGAVAVVEAAGRAAPAFDAKLDIERYDSAAAARAAVRDESVEVAVSGGAIVSLKSPPDELEQILQLASRQVRGAALLRAEGVSPADVERALQPPPLRTLALEGEEDEGQTGVAFVASLLLYGQLIVFGLAVATGVVEEKASRVVEVLLSTIGPRSLLAGKIIGIGLLGLGQLALAGALGLAAAAASGAIELDGPTLATLGVVLVWFVFGYAFYACLYAITGVVVSRQEDLQASSTPLTMVLVVSYLLALPAIYNPGSTLAQVAGLIPFSSPIVMPALVAQGEASAVEIVLSLGVLAVCVALLVPIGARIYEGLILRMGRPTKITEAWRSARGSV